MSATGITPEIGEKILTAYLTERPRPSHRALGERFGVSRPSVQRYISKHRGAIEQTSNRLTKGSVSAEIVVAAIPDAVQRIEGITKDLAIQKLRKTLEEAEAKYESLKDSDPRLAGAYLETMRRTAVDMGGWLGIEGVMAAERERAQTGTLTYDEMFSIFVEMAKDAPTYEHAVWVLVEMRRVYRQFFESRGYRYRLTPEVFREEMLWWGEIVEWLQKCKIAPLGELGIAFMKEEFERIVRFEEEHQSEEWLLRFRRAFEKEHPWIDELRREEMDKRRNEGD